MPRDNGAVVLAAPVGHGLVLAGSADGRVALLDPRAGLKEEHTLTAHSAGLVAAHAQSDTLGNLRIRLAPRQCHP